MTSQSNDKGKFLEDAVEVIERLIINKNPSLSLSVVTIEKRKIVISSGVRHEIDLFIRADPGSGYESIFIFECKDWEKVIGKNEIIVFKRKIDVTKAQKGFFIAKSFSKDARAEAELDERVELIQFEKNSKFEELFRIPVIPTRHLNIVSVHVIAQKAKTASGNPQQIDITTAVLKFRDEILNIKDYLTKLAQEAGWGKINGEKQESFEIGKPYNLKTSKEFEFSDNELFIDGKNVGYLRIDTEFTFQILHPVVLTVYDVATRGRTARLIYELPNNMGKIELGLAQV